MSSVPQQIAQQVARLFGALQRGFRGDHRVWAYLKFRIVFEICRPFKRGLFWLQSGGQDLDRFDLFHLSFRKTAGRRTVDDAMFAAGSAVILGAGQSNIGNECDAAARFAPAGGVFNFNFFDGKCYVARDPLLGAGLHRSNFLTRLGSLLVERGDYRRVLLVPVAHGGTTAQDWSPAGRMFPRLQWTIEQLSARGMKVTHILWQQGEAEAALDKPDPTQWARDFISAAGGIRAAGAAAADAPIYVAQCTVCCNDPNEIIRTAQRSVIDPAANILPGPDIDLIGRDERFDGCHFNAAGLQHAAELWYAVLRRSPA